MSQTNGVLRYDCVIIGGGPAGLTAGIYACRAGMTCLLLEGMFPGGQIVTTHLLENYPGFPQGINGADFGMLLQQQAERLGVEFAYDEVTAVQLAGAWKQVHTATQCYEARTVILCMGAQPTHLGVPQEEKLLGAGVSYCATCDGAFYRDKTVAVVGGGDTALSDAVYLARLAKKVYLIHRRDTFRGAASLQAKVLQEDNIEAVMQCQVAAIEGETHVQGLQLRQAQTTQARTLAVDGVFVAVGTTPRSELVKAQVQCDAAGYIRTDEHMRTSLPGVYAAGDIRVTPLRQVITAAADGALAASDAQRYCMELS